MSDRFQKLEEDFIARVQAANLTPSTEVFLVYHRMDEDGKPLPPSKVSVTPVTRFATPGRPDAAKPIASMMHLHDICDNIRRAIRDLPDGPIYLEGEPQVLGTVHKLELLIENPSEE